ncbi:TolC family protein [Pseudanabaena biceps]|nr:TolC family protein [Pseudanabaena biceps]
MRISSSWLTLGASLSLLIPAWTANAQEFTMPLRPFNKVVLEPDVTLPKSAQNALAANITNLESQGLGGELQEQAIANSQKPRTLISDKFAALTPDISMESRSIVTSTVTENKSNQSSQPSSPLKISSSTEPARVIPSSAASDSGKLDVVQPLVVPTTPSQVKLETTKAVTLEEILELVERTNSDWIQARIAIDRARAALREAEAGKAPTVTGSVQYSYSAQTRINSSTNTNFNTNTTNSSNPLTGTVGIDYNIFDSGVNDSSIRIAENNLRIAESDLNRARQTIRLSITTAYYSLQNADETIRIRNKAVENAAKSLKDTQARERAGVGTKFDVLQSEVQLANAKQDLLNAEAAQLVARRELSRQLNFPAVVEITAADKIAPVSVWKLSLEESIVLAVRNRAELDIRKLEREVARDRANTSLARIGPQVDLFANLNTSTDFASSTGVVLGSQIGARLNWTLYDGGKAAAQVDQFKSDQALAESRFEQDARQTRYDVEESFINQRSRFQQIETATIAVKQAEEALRLARLRLDAGVGTQLEVITAESDFTRADVNRVQAIIGYNQSRANLDRAVSGL